MTWIQKKNLVRIEGDEQSMLVFYRAWRDHLGILAGVTNRETQDAYDATVRKNCKAGLMLFSCQQSSGRPSEFRNTWNNLTAEYQRGAIDVAVLAVAKDGACVVRKHELALLNGNAV